MGNPVLSTEEHDLLLQLSYVDIPSDIAPRKGRPVTMDKLVEKMLTEPNNLSKKQEALIEKLDDHPNLRSLELTGYENDNYKPGGDIDSGFVGYAFKDKQSGESVVMYRGSEGKSLWDKVTNADWLGNVWGGLTGKHPQQRQAEKFFDKHGSDDALLMGHSLGGGLATAVYGKNGYKNKGLKAYVVNPAVFGAPITFSIATMLRPPYLDGLFRAPLMWSDRYQCITTTGDSLSLIPGAGAWWNPGYAKAIVPFGKFLGGHTPWGDGTAEEHQAYLDYLRKHRPQPGDFAFAKGGGFRGKGGSAASGRIAIDLAALEVARQKVERASANAGAAVDCMNGVAGKLDWQFKGQEHFDRKAERLRRDMAKQRAALMKHAACLTAVRERFRATERGLVNSAGSLLK